MNPIELTAVSKSYVGPVGAAPVLVGVDLVVAPGEVVGLAGPSGSGKSTLLSIVVGWEQADSGSVMVLGAPNPAARTWSEVAVVPQSLGLLEELTIAENIGLPRRLSGSDGDEATADLPHRLGLEHLLERHPSEVSLGEQQRTALARALAACPALLVADEPIAHQNHEWSVRIMNLVLERAATGMACLVATHDDVAIDAADRVVFLRRPPV